MVAYRDDVRPRARRSLHELLHQYEIRFVVQARVAQGRIDFALGVWIVHAGMVVLLLFMFAQRMQLIRLRLGR